MEARLFAELPLLVIQAVGAELAGGPAPPGQLSRGCRFQPFPFVGWVDGWRGAGRKTYTSDNACSGSNTGARMVNTAGSPLTVRSSPGIGYTAVGTVADGAGVTIYCQTTGTSVTGTHSTSNMWDRIGTGRFISDAFVYTGYDGFIPGVPRC